MRLSSVKQRFRWGIFYSLTRTGLLICFQDRGLKSKRSDKNFRQQLNFAIYLNCNIVLERNKNFSFLNVSIFFNYHFSNSSSISSLWIKIVNTWSSIGARLGGRARRILLALLPLVKIKSYLLSDFQKVHHIYLYKGNSLTRSRKLY